jgi:hypothetical protein
LPPQIVAQMPAATQRLLRSLKLAELANQDGQAVGQSNAYQAR